MRHLPDTFQTIQTFQTFQTFQTCQTLLSASDIADTYTSLYITCKPFYSRCISQTRISYENLPCKPVAYSYGYF